MINRYGARARGHWQEHRPQEYAQISDPDAFFGRLGRQIADDVTTLSFSIAGDDPEGETYLKKVGRLRMARLQAEEQVLREHLPNPEADQS
jgi:hypothetical protein